VDDRLPRAYLWNSEGYTTMVASTQNPPRGTPQPGCGAEWLDLLHTAEKLVCAGLRREIGPRGDLHAAYRQWYADQMREHDELLLQTCRRLQAADTASEHAS
jgi:hypothetical protein